MNYTVEEIKDILTSQRETYQKTSDREASVRKELANDTLSYTAVLDMISDGATIPDAETGYESFDEWTESLEKQIKTSENSLSNIDIINCVIVAIDYYIAKAS